MCGHAQPEFVGQRVAADAREGDSLVAIAERDGAIGLLPCGGGLSARWSAFKAGAVSASDPKYAVGPQRGAVARGLRRGASRREARMGTRRSAHDPGVTERVASGLRPHTQAVRPLADRNPCP